MLDAIDFKSFQNSSTHYTDDHIAKSRDRQRKSKAKKIDNLLMDSDSIRHLEHFRKFAKEGGLLKDEFRLEIWPILAENLPVATHLDDDSRDSMSLRSNNYSLKVPNGSLASNSRACSESELLFDSARSSFASEFEDSIQDAAPSVSSKFILSKLRSFSQLLRQSKNSKRMLNGIKLNWM
jgi:hypothetical protein